MSNLLIPPLGVAVDHSGWERSEAGFGNAQDNPAGHDFRFQLESRGEHGTKLRSWQEYAVELDDDYYDNYNFNWGYYLESLRLYCDMGTGKPYPAADWGGGQRSPEGVGRNSPRYNLTDK